MEMESAISEKQAQEDKEMLNEISEWISAYSWMVFSCGKSGEIELRRVKEIAPKAMELLERWRTEY